MAFLRFVCFLLVVLPLTSLSIIKFHQPENKNAAQDSFASLKMELLRNNIIGGRRRLEAMKDLMELENSKRLGSGSQENISNMAFSSSSNGENGKLKKKNNNKISSLETKKLGISGSTVNVYNNADYLTYMHHPPKHN